MFPIPGNYLCFFFLYFFLLIHKDMKVEGKDHITIWLKEQQEDTVCIIDQRWLPHKFVIEDIRSVNEMIIAIKDMHVRGAPLIGVSAAWGIYLATLEAATTPSPEAHLKSCAEQLKASRPTAINLQWAVDLQMAAISKANTAAERTAIAKKKALDIAQNEIDRCRQIGEQGVSIIEEISRQKKGKPVNILTHCNAGWLGCVDYGTATAPIYEALKRGIDVHVWVDETRPRNQGASLTAWEMIQQGVPHTVITDNTGGHLMQHGMVDMVITGADRVTRTGDAANKIGTYLKALAASDNGIPFYVALPFSTFDWELTDGLAEIEIEKRDAEEVKYVYGLCEGEIKKVLVTPAGSAAVNYGFDVTPARLITGFITERGIAAAHEDAILEMYPEKSMYEGRGH
jgi:methylthioribose-1-phosphate isomerase